MSFLHLPKGYQVLPDGFATGSKQIVENKDFFWYGNRLTVGLKDHIYFRFKVNQVILVYEGNTNGRIAIVVLNSDSTAKGTNTV